MTNTLTMIAVAYDKLVPADDNVRDEIDDIDDLAASIAATGLQQPLKVQSLGDDEGKYLIIAGHRRHAAIGKLRDEDPKAWAKWQVPCVLNGQLDDSSRVAAMLVENLQRRDLNPIEEAHAFTRLAKEFGWKPVDISDRIGRSVDYVNLRIKLTKLPDDVQGRVRDGSLPLAVAAKLSAIKGPNLISALCARGKVPVDYSIEEVLTHEKVDDLIAKFTKKFDEMGMPTSDERPPFYRKTFFETDDPKKVTLFEGGAPKSAKAYLMVNRRVGTVSAIIARELTDKERASEVDKEEKLRQEQREKYANERAEKAKVEEAAWTDEFKAFKAAQAEWRATCESIRTENREAERVALLRWAKQKPAKDVARLAMLEVVNMADIYQLAEHFGIEADSWQQLQDAVHKHMNDKAENLLAGVVFALIHSDVSDVINNESQAVLEGVEVKDLPPEPTMTDPTTEAAAEDNTEA